MLIINVGDLIEGGTDNVGDLNAQWDAFDTRAAQARDTAVAIYKTEGPEAFA